MTITPREAEILALVRQGKTNKAIAREFGIDYTTVRTHVSNILRKTGAHNRTELAVMALGATME